VLVFSGFSDRDFQGSSRRAHTRVSTEESTHASNDFDFGSLDQNYLQSIGKIQNLLHLTLLEVKYLGLTFTF
jgi:hypothetical protein